MSKKQFSNIGGLKHLEKIRQNEGDNFQILRTTNLLNLFFISRQCNTGKPPQVKRKSIALEYVAVLRLHFQ